MTHRALSPDGSGERRHGSALLPSTPLRTRIVRAVRRLRGVRGVVALALLFLAGVVGHRVGDLARGTPVERVLAPEGLPVPGSDGWARLIPQAAGVTLQGGNRIRVLRDTTLFTVLFREMGGARSSIRVLSYFCQPGRLSDRLTGVLRERARVGVDVFFLGDGFGCREYLGRAGEDLREAGVRVAAHRPVHWWQLHRAQHRNHGRVAIVDGRVAFTGGFGFADQWWGTPAEPPWRETSVQVWGPAVSAFAGAFGAAWAEATGALPLVREDDSGSGADGPDGEAGADAPAVVAGVLVSRPALGSTAADRFLNLSLAGARQRIHLTNSYFVPTARIRTLLTDAARRGVEVHLLLPGPVNDVPPTRWAGQRSFGELLRAGVRIHLYQETMMHAKTLVVDGRWGTVGSMNLDNRSMRLNEEWGLVFDDPGTGTVLDTLFARDLEASREWTLRDHQRRSIWTRIWESLASVVAPLL